MLMIFLICTLCIFGLKTVLKIQRITGIKFNFYKSLAFLGAQKCITNIHSYGFYI